MFLGLGAFAVASIALWTATLAGVVPAMPGHGPLWHGHEMLFGFALAAVAGFLLTAVATWTGRPPVRGMVLLTLAAAWLIGRLALACGPLPSVWVSGVAMLFPLLLATLVAREVFAGRSRRNYPIVALVAALALLDGAYHLGTLGGIADGGRPALLAALYVLVLLVSVIAGRIVPSFTANWLRSRGATRLPASTSAVEHLILPATALAGTLAVLLPDHRATGLAAAVTAALHAWRLIRWRGASTLGEPLVFVLHAAYAWLPVGFALLSASVLTRVVPPTSALHAFAVGAIGVMILAVTTRVALGHTGRPLRASRVTAIAYLLLNLAALLRVAAPAAGSGYLAALDIAALGWMVAWSLFLLTYTPILLGPRVDSPR